MKLRQILPLFSLILFWSCSTNVENEIDLAGEWKFQIDSLDVGISENWFNQDLPEIVKLPGSMTENMKGNNVTIDTKWSASVNCKDWYESDKYAPYRKEGNVKVPYWLQPAKTYVGAAWYQKELKIPEQWSGKNIILNLERVHWYSDLWVDGEKVGDTRVSLMTPHSYNLTDYLAPGNHTITLRIDNNYHVKVGWDSHSVTDHTQTNWNGVIGELSLKATDNVWLQDAQVYPDVQNNAAAIKVIIRNNNRAETTKITINARSSINSTQKVAYAPMEKTLMLNAGDNEISLIYAFDKKAPLWDEYSPELIELQIEIAGEEFADNREITFGMRDIVSKGKHFFVNGKRTIMRGTLECCIFPKTGYPSTDVKEWKRIFTTCKEHGLNHVRFHSYTPPKAAFIAADQVGIYLETEVGVWRGWQGPVDADSLAPWMFAETTRILKEYGNHPSFALFAHGNEPWELSYDMLRDWTKFTKKDDSRRLVCAGAQYPTTFEENDFHIPGCAEGFWFRYHKKFEQEPASTLRNYTNQIAQRDKPSVAHETGQWCVFPNLKEIEKYTGILKANNFEIVKDFLEQNNMLHQAEDFLMASGKFQTLLYKEEIEAYLRTPDIGGYQLLDIHDFPGQGTALVGVLDAFWESKGYVTPEEFNRFNGRVVLLSEMKKRVWTNDEYFNAKILISQFSGNEIKEAKPMWEISAPDGSVVAQGELSITDIQRGSGIELGTIDCSLSEIGKASRLTLKVSLKGTDYYNEWGLWVYPKTITRSKSEVIFTSEWRDAITALDEGKKVLFAPGPDLFGGKTAGTFEPIFWNKLWFPAQKPHTLGILCKPKHGALNDFPSEFHSNWQWQDIQQNSKPIILDNLPVEVQAIIQPIDDWNECRKLGLLFEAKTSKGKLMVCSVDLSNNIEKRPVARQLKYSINNYMNSDDFNPTIIVNADEINGILKKK